MISHTIMVNKRIKKINKKINKKKTTTTVEVD